MVGGWISNLGAAARQRGQLIGALAAVISLAFTAIWGRGLLEKSNWLSLRCEPVCWCRAWRYFLFR